LYVEPHTAYTLERVKLTAIALLEAGIQNITWNPCWLVSENDNNEYNLKTRAILEELREFPIMVSCGNVVEPEGKALTELGAYFQKSV
jgi:hypothetical protein